MATCSLIRTLKASCSQSARRRSIGCSNQCASPPAAAAGIPAAATATTRWSRSGPSRNWHGPKPGYLEIDLVTHCGGNMAGSFIQSLSVTDVASGWVEAVPLLAREQTLVTEALEMIAGRVPFPILGRLKTTTAPSSRRLLSITAGSAGTRVHPRTRLPLQRPGLHRTKERRRYPTVYRLRALWRLHRRTDPGPTLCLC